MTINFENARGEIKKITTHARALGSGQGLGRVRDVFVILDVDSEMFRESIEDCFPGAYSMIDASVQAAQNNQTMSAFSVTMKRKPVSSTVTVMDFLLEPMMDSVPGVNVKGLPKLSVGSGGLSIQIPLTLSMVITEEQAQILEKNIGATMHFNIAPMQLDIEDVVDPIENVGKKKRGRKKKETVPLVHEKIQ